MNAEFYRAGGIFMHPITFWGLMAAVFIVLQMVRRDRSYAGLIWGSLGLAVLCGVMGVVAGLIESFAAITEAPADMRDRLLRQSLGIALNPLFWALLWAAVMAHFALPITWWVHARRRTAPPASAV